MMHDPHGDLRVPRNLDYHLADEHPAEWAITIGEDKYGSTTRRVLRRLRTIHREAHGLRSGQALPRHR
jgi:hypothetical protein